MSRIIGLTGGIGSGKSTVSALFHSYGADIIDADEISRHSLDKGAECYIQTVAAFGSSILHTDGSVNRKALADIVFKDEARLQQLNSIVHPFVRKNIYLRTSYAKQCGANIIVWDIPLLFEDGYDKEADAIVVVTCPINIRLERLKERSGMTETEALSRISSQLSDEERVIHANYIIDNSGSLETLKHKAKEVYESIIKKLL